METQEKKEEEEEGEGNAVRWVGINLEGGRRKGKEGKRIPRKGICAFYTTTLYLFLLPQGNLIEKEKKRGGFASLAIYFMRPFLATFSTWDTHAKKIISFFSLFSEKRCRRKIIYPHSQGF